MKKLITLFTAFAFVIFSFAAVTAETPTKNANEIFVPLGNSGSKISLAALSQISVKEFELVSGKKLKFAEKITLKLAQRDLRKSINEDGTINSKRLEKSLKKFADGESGFHIGGFALGFLLGLIGVLIAYLIKDDKKSNRVKWAWLGLAAWVVILLIALVL